jgi:predicted RNA binding protein YcfA (HicA-like mRNA interferase family)
MPKLAPVSPRLLIAFFLQFGYREAGQVGSHLKLSKPGALRPLIVPMHREVSSGVIRANLRTAGIDAQRFLAWLRHKDRRR